ncbi:aldose epimerase [Clostridium swellfunianum]|uniref:aldose epimerase family protein n=1 Tax=Clostridium swellfunianum TaxID=1367462 RepID=UPI00202E2432|nr:aldose epimerase [Clostridium swellfunianum]MCM0649927.1 aldose epimerase [Clostridium swellfunianum]
MYSVNKYEDKFFVYELREESTNSSIKLCPERGAIITNFVCHGKELLYLDKETFYDTDANIRGGIPILFPISGQLKEGKYELDGKTYFMKNHGVARINSWEVIETCADNRAAIKLRLKSNEDTLKAFPFDFELVFTYILKDGKLTIEQEYKNNSSNAMPIQAGFHPYFETLNKNISYSTDAEKYLDYNDMQIKDYTGSVDLTNMVESAAFIDANKNIISFELKELSRKICLEYGKEFKYIVIWSVKGKDFVCVEPWMEKNGALNTGNGLQYIEAGRSLKTYFNISAEFTK